MPERNKEQQAEMLSRATETARQRTQAAWAEYEAPAQAQLKNMDRLRKERLDKEAADATKKRTS
jgi:hypothetical protein